MKATHHHTLSKLCLCLLLTSGANMLGMQQDKTGKDAAILAQGFTENGALQAQQENILKSDKYYAKIKHCLKNIREVYGTRFANCAPHNTHDLHLLDVFTEAWGNNLKETQQKAEQQSQKLTTLSKFFSAKEIESELLPNHPGLLKQAVNLWWGPKIKKQHTIKFENPIDVLTAAHIYQCIPGVTGTKTYAWHRREGLYNSVFLQQSKKEKFWNFYFCCVNEEYPHGRIFCFPFNVCTDAFADSQELSKETFKQFPFDINEKEFDDVQKLHERILDQLRKQSSTCDVTSDPDLFMGKYASIMELFETDEQEQAMTEATEGNNKEAEGEATAEDTNDNNA